MIYICIYSFYKDDFLERCLKSIKISSTKEIFVDLYIFSKKNINQEQFKIFKNMEVTVLHKQKNFSQVTNIGLRKAKVNNAKFFMLLNSDTVLDVLCIEKLQSTLRKNKDIGVVGGYQIEYDSKEIVPNEWTLRAIRKSQANQGIEGGFDFYETEYVQGACMMIRINDVENFGFFNEKFQIFYEETEYCRRVINLGYKVGIVKEALVQHFGGGTWKKNYLLRIKRDVYYLSNQIIFESTSSYLNCFDIVVGIMRHFKRQFTSVLRHKDNLKISIVLYPFVILFTMSRVRLWFDLLHGRKRF